MIYVVKLPNEQFRVLVSEVRENSPYLPKEQRPISWPEYTTSQIQDAKETLCFISEVVDQMQPWIIMKTGKPLTDVRILTKAVLFAEMLRLPERQAQGWLELLGHTIGIQDQIDDRVLGEAYDRPEVVYLLRQIFEETKQSDGTLAGDGTGLETTRKQNYESTKRAGEYMTSIVDSRELVQAFDVSGKQECQAMHDLIGLVEGHSLRLDAGFVDRELIDKIAQHGLTPFVFPKKNMKLNGSLIWKNMYLAFFYQLLKWLREFHQRSHTESFHSSFKRRFGIITKQRFTCKLSQVTARIIIHNRRRLAYFSRLPKAG